MRAGAGGWRAAIGPGASRRHSGGVLIAVLCAAAAVGSAGAAARDDVLRGGGGPDRLSGGPGDDRLYGGAGSDRLKGGAGDDRLYGGAGGDLLRGGAGGDLLTGGPGRDRILARGEGTDRIECGSGRDIAYVDASDRVRGCEEVAGRKRPRDAPGGDGGSADGEPPFEGRDERPAIPGGWPSGAPSYSAPAPAGRPNIVLILTDDQRYDSVTPDIMPRTSSLLAGPGLTFANAFVTRSLCCPSRASILTGQYAHNHGVLQQVPPNGGFQAFNDTSTVATWLHETGYRTGLVGRYLFGYGAATGYGGQPAGPLYVPPGWDTFVVFTPGGGGDYAYGMNISGQYVQGYGDGPEDYSTDVLKRHALDFIDAAEQQDAQPFYLEIGTTAPHGGTDPAPGDENALADLPPNRPPSFNEADLSDKPSFYQGGSQLPEDSIAALDARRLTTMRTLVAVDRAVAAIVAKLDALGELENTLIVLTTDNGYMWGEHRKEGKLLAYEESIRVPLIVRGPGVRTGTTDAIAANIDLAPTFADLARAEPTLTVDGRSLAPVLAGNESGWRDDILVESWTPWSTTPDFLALRTSGHTYVEHDNGERELYDLGADPYQLESLLRQSSPPSSELRPLADSLFARLGQLATCQGSACR